LISCENLHNFNGGFMPEISRFLGIIIMMQWRDHNPPHIHARYGEYEITVDINNLVIEGKFPRRALNLVFEWVELHRTELLEDWELAQKREPLKAITPLE